MNLMYLWAKALKKFRGSALKNSNIDATSKVEPGSHVVNSVFGKHSYCGYDCAIVNCRVGSFCSISDNVIIGGARHPMEWVSTSPVFRSGRDSVKAKFSNFDYDGLVETEIGHDVWIGGNVLIKAGVKIGNGAVIGMGSVVTKDVEMYTVVAGNPARVINRRFTEEVAQKLEKTKWWDFPEEKLRKYSAYIQSPEEFISKVETE